MPLHDVINALRSLPIEASLSTESILSLRQSISSLPGESLEFMGSFSRKRHMSIPIKESFKLTAKATQTGYPHPMQHIGMSFSEKLLPHLFLRPYLVPLFQQLLDREREIAERLLPSKGLNKQAKELLVLRKAVFRTHKGILLAKQKQFVHAFFTAAAIAADAVDPYFTKLLQKLDFFEESSILHAKVITDVLHTPLLVLQNLWVHKGVESHIESQNILRGAIDNAPFTNDPYELAYRTAISKALFSVSGFIFSESFDLPVLSLDLFFEKNPCCHN